MTGEEEEMKEDTHQDQEAVLDLTKGGQCTTGEVVVVEEIHALVLHQRCERGGVLRKRRHRRSWRRKLDGLGAQMP